MRSINKVIIIGNVTRDPEIKQTVNGQPIATFGIATNRDWMTRNGEHHTSSEFHEVVAWSKLADICSKYIRKGKLIYIEGYLKTRSWDTPEGVKKFRTEIVVNDLIMLDKRAPGENEPVMSSENMGGEDMGMESMPYDMPMDDAA
ncbi:MAG: single-stranded DNA-binding protein [Candidatus Gracilibacteria bacterium]